MMRTLDAWRSKMALRPQQRRQLWAVVLLALAAAFPLVDQNAANTDAMANAFVYVLLALGLNIVVGFAGLLDLGYAAFFAVGAYAYAIVASFQLKPEWSDVWLPF